jgi:hypothetical protein
MWSVLRGPGPKSHIQKPQGRETVDPLPERHRFLLSRAEGGWNEKKIHTPCWEAKTAEVEVKSSSLDHGKAAVLNSLRSTESKRGYGHAIDEFIEWYCSEPRLSFSKRYRIHLEERHLAAGTQFLLGHVSVQTADRYLGCKAKGQRSRQRRYRYRTVITE